MKNRIITYIISALLIFTCFATNSFAEDKSSIFTVENTDGYKTEFIAEPLEEVTVNFFNECFDKGSYNAEFYGAYRASITENDIPVAFTDNMNVTINLGEEYAEKEIFVFYITNGTVSEFVDGVREGSSFTISGKDFSAISNNIIVVMTSNKNAMTGIGYTVIPAVICAGVALVAIVGSVFVIKNKSKHENIIN